MPSFVLLLFAVVPTDGALIRTEHGLSVVGAVVDMHVHVIFAYVISAANPLEYKCSECS